MCCHNIKGVLRQQPFHQIPSKELYVSNDIAADLNVQISDKPSTHHREVGTQGGIKNLDKQRLIFYELVARIF